MLGLLYRQGGQPTKSAEHLQTARALAQKAVEAAPNVENLDTLASVYYAMRDYVQAEAMLQKALELAPDNSLIRSHLDQIRQAKQRKE